jgi:diguanylate cyclase (GGDEF)-like protein
MRRRSLFDPRRLAFRLYSILGIAVGAIVALAYAGSHMAAVTAKAAVHLSRDGLDGIVKASELNVLIEQHRRIVEAAPAEIDRRQIARNRDALRRIEAAVTLQTRGRSDDAARTVADRLPLLTAQADQVLFLAENFATDSAADAVDVYERTAGEVQSAVLAFRERQQSAADVMVEALVRNASALINWGTSAGIIALTVLAPMGLLVLGDGARRLRGLWQAMYRIARNDIAHPVPSLCDVDEIGDMARAVQVFKDNAIALASQRGEIEQVNRFLDIALNNMARGLSMFDASHRLVICNESYRALYDLPQALTARGTPWSSIEQYRADHLGHVESGSERDGAVASLADLVALRQRASAHQTLRDGRIIAIAVQPLDDGGWVAVHEDVTRQRQAEARITKLARQDTLTGLSNRHVFREEIERRCDKGAAPFALLLIDLDKFKLVNDTLGHPIGDALLEAVAERLRTVTRATDIVARLGGDEFAILQDGAVTAETSLLMANRLIDVLSQPFGVFGHRIIIGASIGIALSPDHGDSASALFGHADLALYAAKDAGRGTALVFEPRMKDAVLAERLLTADLKSALAEDQFELFYQPILDLSTGQTTSCEALLRWRHPSRGLVPPMDFIPYAEASGLIVPIGRWALRRACSDAVTWPDHVGVAVNLSAVQVLAGDLIADLAAVLDETGLRPDRLELEVTETLLLADEPATRETLLKVRDLGVRVALDDFGTGYASLSYLRRFPFNKLKIDQSFVRDITDQQVSTAIVRAVASLASSLDITAVAEGVETKAHLARVATAGCAQVQGYLFSRPVPAGDIQRVIATCAIPKLEDEDWLTTASARRATQ